jgi:hypothetical protein
VDIILCALIEMGELSLADEDAVAAWHTAHELCERLEREGNRLFTDCVWDADTGCWEGNSERPAIEFRPLCADL